MAQISLGVSRTKSIGWAAHCWDELLHGDANGALKRIVLLLIVTLAPIATWAQNDWPAYGHDPGAQRYSPLTQITPSNVKNLTVAWTYDMMPPANATDGSSGAASPFSTALRGTSEMTPLVIKGTMYVVTPDGRAVALKPETGKVIWEYKSSGVGRPGQRSLAYWPGDENGPPEIVFGTEDGYLVALEAESGKPVSGFGHGGVLNLRSGLENSEKFPDKHYGLSSPPLIYRNLLITGSHVQEQPRLGPYGDVMAWDARTGNLVWTFHSVPRPGEAGHESWAGDSWQDRSGTNIWGMMTVDVARGIIYLPFGCSTYDFYGGDRQGANLYGDTLVALDAVTGKMKWYFQTTHHDLWDYDLNSPPALLDVHRDGEAIPAVAQMTKQGLLFIFNRLTGKPIFGVEERPVPQDGFAPGEHPWPTQPFPVKPVPLSRNTFSPDEIAKVTPAHEQFCKQMLEANGGLHTGGPYLPSTSQGTVLYPSTLGGNNWSGGAFDPQLGYFIVNIQNLGEIYTSSRNPNGDWIVQRKNFQEPSSLLPCVKPPWGQLVAVNVNTGDIAWKVPLGAYDDLEKAGVTDTGALNIGGPIITATGLVFIGATVDGKFRAFDAKTGKQLWGTALGAAAHAIPITYQGSNGKQYVAIVVSGGGFLMDKAIPAKLVVFALP